MIRRHANEIRADHLRYLPHWGWGGDSDAWLVDGQWIFRFPRTEEVMERLAIEVCLLPKLAPRLPVAIPRFSYVVRGDNNLPAFVGYHLIAGEPLRGEALRATSADTVARLSKQLGNFLGALHQTPLAEAESCGLATPTIDIRTAEEQRYAELQATVFPVLAADERAWVERRYEEFLANPRHFHYARTLCHGDLSSDHILWRPVQGALTGIIDFGDLAIADPAHDFLWRDEYGQAFFEQVLRAYNGPADATLASRVAFRSAVLPLIEVATGVESGRTDYIDEGRQELQKRMDHPLF